MTDADHDLILTQIRNQLTTPLPIGTDHPPRQENPAMSDLTDCTRDLGNEIARVRHGDDCTASDLAERLSPWLAEHDRQAAERAWGEGYTSGHSNAMRMMSDEPTVVRTTNPYRQEQTDD